MHRAVCIPMLRFAGGTQKGAGSGLSADMSFVEITKRGQTRGYDMA